MTLLFLLIGMAADLKILVGMIGLILAMSVIVIAARGLSVYSFVPLTVKLFKLPTITLGERHVMWWGGLKGGLAIAIVLSVPIDFPGRELLLNLTPGDSIVFIISQCTNNSSADCEAWHG